MESPEIIPRIIKSTNFWTGKETLARGLVDGLLASSYLWIFWAPFITGIALPLNTASVKSAICWLNADNKHNVPGITYLPGTTYHNASKLLTDDNSEMYPQNELSLSILWICAVIWVIFCFWIANTIIKAAGLIWWDVMIFNLTVAVLIAIIEVAFFAGVALQYNPYDYQTIYDNILPPTLDKLNEFIAADEAPIECPPGMDFIRFRNGEGYCGY